MLTGLLKFVQFMNFVHCWFESFEEKKLYGWRDLAQCSSFDLKTFSYTATGFIITQDACTHVMLPSHPPSNDSMLKCLHLLFISERDSRLIGMGDRRPLIGNRWDNTKRSMSMDYWECDHGVNLSVYVESGSYLTVTGITGVCHLP